ncbi:MAG: L,D-transpeptidase family protein [Ginsengibacter sp.]
MIICFASCKTKRAATEIIIVDDPQQMDAKIAENIKAALLFAQDNSGKINDTIALSQFDMVNKFYEKNDFQNIWSKEEIGLPLADSLFQFINNAAAAGLYRADYHFSDLDSLRYKIANDSLVRRDANAWTKADIMYTDAFMRICKDLKEGRLLPDSVSITRKSNYVDSFFIKNLLSAKNGGNITNIFSAMEPDIIDYQHLRSGLKEFVLNMDSTRYLYINYPYKDTAAFMKSVIRRLQQAGFKSESDQSSDSSEFKRLVKKYQQENGLVVDGKPGQQVINKLNLNDREKFRRIAVTLDRYKLLPTLPENYIWANIPEYYLKVMDNDSVVLRSKIIVGKPLTRTPLIVSAISDMVTYPKWTIPQSIIRKDILPQLKVNPGYLARKGFSLVDSKGETVDPYSVNWSKYKKGIPWNVVQGSGDDNALGIFKFNFNNPYSVYLHDTNQRYLFSNKDRALSHGCVRVQNWQALSYFIARRDSLAMPEGKSPSYNEDSLKTWIANKDRKRIMVKKPLSLFIVYFTCIADDLGQITFYNDIYNDDQNLARKYFSGK